MKKENDKLKQQLEEIYEALVGDNGMERFTHAELIDWAHQLVDKEEVVESSRETIRIPITENDFEHELKNLVFNGEEFEWGAFYTVETERAIDVEFIGDQNE